VVVSGDFLPAVAADRQLFSGVYNVNVNTAVCTVGLPWILTLLYFVRHDDVLS
jgi:hypothetical protein